MTRCRSISWRKSVEVGLRHHHDLAAARHHREAQHTGRVGQRREREVDRPALERVAHQGQRRHRLEVAAGEHHALGRARRTTGADDHRDVVDRRRSSSARPERRRSTRRTTPRTPARRRGRPASSASAARRGSGPPAARSRTGRAGSEQSKRSSSSAFSRASLRGLIGHHTAPAREMPKTQANDSELLADRIATLSPGRTPDRSRARATVPAPDAARRRTTWTDRPSSGRVHRRRGRRPCPDSRSAACRTR